MKKAILTGLTALLIGTGCASTSHPTKETAKERGYATRQEAMELLGIRSPNLIQDIKGYKMHIGTAGQMRGLAALQSGKGYVTQDRQLYKDGKSTTTITRTHYSTNYTWSDIENLGKILLEADIDGNMIIDREEARAIREEVYRKHKN